PRRGVLQKTISCLREVHERCSGNARRLQELDMLFSIEAWRRGRALLCGDLNLFKEHFECVSQFGPRISACILLKTQLFRQAVTEAGLVPHDLLHDITCNFAENIVMCLERPLARACPLPVVETMTRALHEFLPPACAPIPAVWDRHWTHAGDTERGQARGDQLHGDAQGQDQGQQSHGDGQGQGQGQQLHGDGQGQQLHGDGQGQQLHGDGQGQGGTDEAGEATDFDLEGWAEEEEYLPLETIIVEGGLPDN
ncbi:hypothetical protein EGW08_004281, partial [Elysia chlorotica]